MTPEIPTFEFGTIADALATEGYWSRRTVYLNDSAKPIWYGSQDVDAIASTLKSAASSAFDEYCANFARLIVSHVERPDFNRYVGSVLKSYGLRSSPLSAWALQHAPPIKRHHPDFKAAVLSLLSAAGGQIETAVKVIVSVYVAAGGQDQIHRILNREFSARMDSPSAMIRVDWPGLFSTYGLFPAVSLLIELSRISHEEAHKGDTVYFIEHAGHLGRATPVTNTVFEVTGGTAYPNYINLLGLRTAAGWALLTLLRHGHVLFPLRWKNVHISAKVYGAAWWPELGAYMPDHISQARRLFHRMICTATARSPADFSVDFCRKFSPASTGMCGSMEKGFAVAIQRFRADHPDLAPFPLGEINNRRTLLLKEEDEYAGSPEKLRADGFLDWAMAVETFYRLAPSSRDGKRNAVRPLLDWALGRGYRSPWEIQTRNLLNPLDPTDQSTFHAFLLNCPLTVKRDGWGSAARFYKVVYNALKPLPEYDKLVQTNPFHGLARPFRDVPPKTPIGKTFRRLLPEHLLRAMLDTLLDCDENGVPQYTWAKKRFPDLAERFNHVTKQYEVVWHPARARCMAILLMIPLRGKQARWLDHGLMDEKKWDVATDTWTENTHPLRNFRYANGQTHAQSYGRPSGVLQPIESLLATNESHIGLFISTNKTSLWHAERRAGYSIPWPDGKELRTSVDIRVKEQGFRLGLVYQIIRDQIRWMETYDPNPVPVHFGDDAEDFDPETAALLPVFCPIFRDLMSPASRRGIPVHVPVSKMKIDALFHALAAETEDRLVASGHPTETIGLTIMVRNQDTMIRLGRAEMLRRCAYDIHSLRVAGITHLLELGVPAHIVSEFIAGHMALVMTLHYAKFQPLKLRQEILDAFSETKAIEEFEARLADRSTLSATLVCNEHFSAEDRPSLDDVFAIHGTWRYVNGGVCPGASCSEGGIQIVSAGKAEKKEIVPVHGGPESCGNCRFFLTSPAFLVPQMLNANSIMLQLRELGRHRKRLWDERAALELEIFEGTRQAGTSVELATINAELERIERKLEPMVLEWYNRYEMFRRSCDLVDASRRPGNHAEDERALTLYGSSDAVEYAARLDPQGSEYLLVKEIVSQAELIGGRRVVSELAEHKLREFIDQILIQERVADLLLTIPDETRRRRAALMLANALEVLAGGQQAISEAATAGKPLRLDRDANQALQRLAANLKRGSVTEADLDELRAEALRVVPQMTTCSMKA